MPLQSLIIEPSAVNRGTFTIIMDVVLAVPSKLAPGGDSTASFIYTHYLLRVRSRCSNRQPVPGEPIT